MTQHKVSSKSSSFISELFHFPSSLERAPSDPTVSPLGFFDMRAVLFVAFGLQVWTAVTGYPTGAPVGRCVDMTPGHNVPPQSSTSPYTIVVSSTTFSTNKEIKGNLKCYQFDLFYFITALKTSERRTQRFGTVTVSLKEFPFALETVCC